MPLRSRPSMLPLALALASVSACSLGPSEPIRPPQRDTVSIVSPRCEGVRSCVLGHVTAAGTATPIAEAAVFLEREPEADELEPIRILALTDAQGVFEVDDPPPGSYRLAIYKDDSSIEVAGIELGRAGTTILPVRLRAD